MTDCIDRDMLLKMISHKPSSPTTEREDRLINGFISAVKNCPATNVRPVVRGKWEDETGFIFSDLSQQVRCSKCGLIAYFYDKMPMNFCPSCGADMMESKQETKQVGILEGGDLMDSKTKWIPVTERLPDADGFTLIFTAHGYPGVCYFTSGWWGGYDKDGITHWMPLPEPPKEE